MNISQMQSVQNLNYAIKELMAKNSSDWKNELKIKTNEFKENFWFEIFETASHEVADFNRHNSRLGDLLVLVKNGQNIRELIANEDKVSKYWFDKPYGYLKNQFDEKIDNYLGSFLEVMMETKKNKNEKFDAERMYKFMIDHILLAENKCCQCGNKFNPFGDNEKCEMNIPVIQETYIQVPSGNLIVADWFRDNKNVLQKLTDVKNTVIGKKLMEINSYEAQYGDSYLVEYAQVLSAAELNIATVFVGNSSPDIFQKGNNILGFNANSYESEREFNKKIQAEMPEWKKKGSICTDLWRASVIDEKTFINHLSTEYSREEAEKIVAEIKSEWTVVNIKVKPGKYKLTYTMRRGFIEKNSLGGINFKLELFEE